MDLLQNLAYVSCNLASQSGSHLISLHFQLPSPLQSMHKPYVFNIYLYEMQKITASKALIVHQKLLWSEGGDKGRNLTEFWFDCYSKFRLM